ncbi:hypothetical protein ACI799_18905 [Blastococcus sp. SYSU DS0753]
MFRWSARRRDEEPEIPGMVSDGRRRRTRERSRAVAGPEPAAVREPLLIAAHEDHWLLDIVDGEFVDDAGTDWGQLDGRACSDQLLRWFDAGLLELRDDSATPARHPERRRISDLPLLPPDAARELLSRPDVWLEEGPGAYTTLAPTELGRSTPAGSWP